MTSRRGKNVQQTLQGPLTDDIHESIVDVLQRRARRRIAVILLLVVAAVSIWFLVSPS